MSEVVWYGLFNRWGQLVSVDGYRPALMKCAEEAWGCSWRNIRRRGDMYIHTVIVDTQEATK